MRVISFTTRGNQLNLKLTAQLDAKGFSVKEHEKLEKISLYDFAKCGFENCEPMIFIGAAGIAVRAISGFVKDKFTDPPVIVIDEKGKFVIPILSGHVGGGNELALTLSAILNAEPVITTATDINNVFAVDVFARKNDLIITERDLAKKVSAQLLADKGISIYSEKNIDGMLPNNLNDKLDGDLGVYVGVKNNMPYKETLHLVPKSLCVGIGCKRGTGAEKIEESVCKVFEIYNLQACSIFAFGSIDIKKDEEGLLQFAKSKEIDIKFFRADELEKLEGDFTASEFVKSVTGTDNVCERSAVLASDRGEIIVPKYSNEGVTIAVAEKNWSVKFE